MRGKLILKLFVIFLCWLSAPEILGQAANTDSSKVNSPKREFAQQSSQIGDTIQFLNSRADSLEDRLGQDNIASRSDDKVDSIQSVFNQRSDSLKNAYDNKLSMLDASQRTLQKKLDSLTTLNLPAGKVSSSLDSVRQLRESAIAGFEKKLRSIKDETAAKLGKLDLPPEATEKINSVTKNIDAISLPAPALDVPPLNASVNSLGNGNDLPGINNPVRHEGQLPSVNENLSGVSNVTNQVSEYSKEAEQISKGNLDEVKNIPKTAEEKATDLSGIKEVDQQAKGLEQYEQVAAKAGDPDALKKEAVEKAKNAAVDHFAGKQEQLKAAMEKISQYKKKYPNLNSITELSKKPTNEMRGKPLVERIVPGVALQMQKKGEDLLVDFNPYAAYRFTRRISAGLGWNQRVGYNTDQYRFNPAARIYGPRAFGEFKLGKGFSPRAEIEVMNTGIPPLSTTTYDPSRREWIRGAFAGMKKDYKLFKKIRGTAMVMARLFNYHRKSPYADILNVRFGFEFPMKKKVKDSGKV